MAIKKVSNETKEIIRANSVESLPDRPSEKGYSAKQLKEYFTNLVLGDVSSLTELDRVVDEINDLIGNIENTDVKTYVVNTVVSKFIEQAPYISLKFEDNKLKYTKYGNPSISGELDIIPENSVFFNNQTLRDKNNEIIYPVTTLDNVLMGDESIQDLILAVQTRLAELEENHDKDIKTIEDNLNAILGGDAPAALDSIKELAEALKNNPSSIDDILLQLSNLNTNKVDKVSGKGLSTNDYTNEDKSFVETLKTKDVALKTDIKTNLSQMGQDSNYRTVTDDEKSSWNSKANGVHKHEISDVNRLQDTLDNKSDVGHTHNISDLGGEPSGTSELLLQDHNNSSVAHADIREKINEVENKVNGINNALSFDTTSQLSDWFSGTYNRDDGKKPSDLYVGQYLYIRGQDEDDYWVSTIPANMGNLSVLETDKIDLTEYPKSADLKRVAFTGKYSDLEGIPTIPSTLAELGQDDNHRTITQEKLNKIDTIDNKLDKNLGSNEANKMLITDASGNVVTAQAGSMAVLVDNLESTSTTMAPTANQVRVLNNKKLDKQLGSENAGKFLKVNDDGVVDLGEVETDAVTAEPYLDSASVPSPLDNYYTKSQILDFVYPVGSIYITLNVTNPAYLFGGTWEKIDGKFLLASDDKLRFVDDITAVTPGTYRAGSTGGEAYHTLTNAELPTTNQNFFTGSGSAGWSAPIASSGQSNGVYSMTLNMTKGENQPHNNMPPYLAVYMFKRVS